VINWLPRGFYRRNGIIWIRTDPMTGRAASTGAKQVHDAIAWRDARRSVAGSETGYRELWDAFVAVGSAPNGQWVYFVQSPLTGFVKIGFTTSFWPRMASLNTSCPGGVEIQLVLVGGRDLEKRCHQLFAAHCFSGEWFRREGILFRFLEEMAAEPKVAA
jgi:hypothetical protein